MIPMKATSNNFTLDNGIIVSDEYARRRIIASLQGYGISLDERRNVADSVINNGHLFGYTCSGLCRTALDYWINDII